MIDKVVNDIKSIGEDPISASTFTKRLAQYAYRPTVNQELAYPGEEG